MSELGAALRGIGLRVKYSVKIMGHIQGRVQSQNQGKDLESH